MFLNKLILIVIIFFTTLAMMAQDVSRSRLDNLAYEELLTLFDEVAGDSVAAEKVARAYLNRARTEADTIKMARGYDRLARIFHPEKNISFADSLIALTKDMEHITYPAMGYMLKTYHYGTLDDLINRTNNINQVYFLAKKNNNITHELFALHIIITNKSFWGDKEEALEIQRYRQKLLKKSSLKDDFIRASRKEFANRVPFLIQENKVLSLYAQSFCNVNLGRYDLASKYLQQAFELNNKMDWPKKDSYRDILNTLQLELYYYKRNENEFFELQKELLRRPNIKNNPNSMFDIFGFTGLWHLSSQRFELAKNYLLKSDSIYINNDLSLLPYQREFFVGLLDYYIREDDKERQLEYYKKLIEIDSVFKINYRFFESEVTNRIEVPMLLSEKEAKINSLEKLQMKSNKFIGWLWLSVGVFLLANFLLIRRHILYKKRVQRLIDNTNSSKLTSSNNEEEGGLGGLTSEVVKDILDKLERFEHRQKYRNPEINLHKLAKRFKTNARYLSKVVNFKKEKNFSQYLNELRVNYSVEALRNDPNYRKYTIKAIAELSGFSSAESYSRAFKKKFGIHPSYFIKELLKNKSADPLGAESLIISDKN